MSAEEQLCRVNEGTRGYDAQLQAVNIGDVTLLGVPGEVFSEMGSEIAKLSANKILTVGYANGYVGYIANNSHWAAGGYEVSLGMWSKVSAEAYCMVMDGTRHLIRGGYN